VVTGRGVPGGVRTPRQSLPPRRRGPLRQPPIRSARSDRPAAPLVRKANSAAEAVTTGTNCGDRYSQEVTRRPTGARARRYGLRMSHHAVAAGPGRRPGTADFLAVNRGGGLFSEALSQRIGAAFSLAAHRLGLAPSVLTIVGVTIGLGSS